MEIKNEKYFYYDKNLKGWYKSNGSSSNKHIILKCQICGEKFIGIPNRKFCGYLCARKNQWNNKSFRNKMSKTMSNIMKHKWSNKEYKLKTSQNIKLAMQNPDVKIKMSESSKLNWDKIEYRDKINISMNKLKDYFRKNNKITMDTINKNLKIKYPFLYKEYCSLRKLRNKQQCDIDRMNEIWDKIYRKNNKIKNKIRKEIIKLKSENK